MENINSSNYWQDRYASDNTQWDIGYPSTPIVGYIDGLKNKNLSILIPGCGNAYEAKYILDKGFTNLTVIDFATEPVEKLKKELFIYEDTVNIIEDDFFNHKGQYDLIIEQTFFCALTSDRRADYVRQMKSLLSENGKLVGVLFNRNFEGGPPFGGSVSEYKKLFSAHFTSIKIEDCYNSIPARAGTEVFINIS